MNVPVQEPKKGDKKKNKKDKKDKKKDKRKKSEAQGINELEKCKFTLKFCL